MTSKARGRDDLPHGKVPEDQVIPGVESYLSELAGVYRVSRLDEETEQSRTVRDGSMLADAEPLTLF